MTHYAEQGNIVMCLAQLLNDPDDRSYAETMNKLSCSRFTLLDNGANEGQILSDEALAHTAELFAPDELVLPDVLGNADETYSASTTYLMQYARANTSYIGVVQGSNIDELKGLIDRYAKVPSITTLGLPRLLVDRMKQAIRFDMTSWVTYQYPRRFQIHFLGASSSWPKEPYYAGRYSIPVRSIDTSLPFNYGLAGIALEDFRGATGKKIDRPKDYFTKWHQATGLTTIEHNLTVYKEWCNGKKTPSSDV